MATARDRHRSRKELMAAVTAQAARERGKVHALACCDQAVFLNCVCAWAFRCPIHGDRHIGTHD